MTKGILGKKVGMTQVFTDNGELVPVTVIDVTPNVVLQVKTVENDGYNAVLGENEQGMLRVIVASFDDKADAAASRDAIKAKYAPNFQDAWLLERQY